MLSNGAKQDVVTGHIVAGAPLTPERARDMASRRQSKAQAKVREAIAGADTTHDSANASVYGGWKTVALAQVQLALAPEQGRASTEAAKWLGRASGLLSEQHDAVQQPAVRLELGAAAVEALGRLLARRDGGLARRQLPPEGSG